MIERHGNDQLLKKLIDLYEKYTANEFVITFAGHFSAGKSSMINTLLQAEVLPNSPIPTSANIVKIKAGNGDAYVHFNNQQIVRYQAPYDLEKIKQFCMNKTDIHLVELSTKNNVLPNNLTLIDTPGIDAADDYDRQLTEASLHLTDLLVYVMDYNHVQSEVNLQFLKQLQIYDIPFYIIVNQIDKHSDKEISFVDYQSLIKETFTDWDLDPLNIFFTSLKDLSLPANDFEQLQTSIFTAQTKTINHNRPLNHIVKEHEQFIQTIYEEKLQEIVVTKAEKASYTEAKQQLSKINEQTVAITSIKQQLDDELTHTLNNAYLMPFETREQARLFLESQQSDFKVGFFRRQQKTEQERNKRLKTLLKTIQTTVDTTITWSLREKFKRMIDQAAITDRSIDSMLQLINITLTTEHLQNLVHSGAVMNGAYVLNYTNQLSDSIKQLFKRAFNDFWIELEKHFLAHANEQQTLYDEHKQLAKQYEQKLAHQEILHREQNEQITQLEAALEQATAITDDHLFETILAERKIYDEESFVEQTIESDQAVFEKEKAFEDHELTNVPIDQMKSDQIIHLIDETIQTINDLPSFQTIIEDLRAQKETLTNQQLTIALFGAFSAGKSSFANALMGHNILPSSPHPMTAAITKIHPVTKAHEHGTIIVTFKNEQTIINDLLMMLSDFKLPEHSLEQLIHALETENILQADSLEEMFRTYISSVVLGYETMQDNFGQQRSVTYEQFSEFATDETKACFIESIDLYYECELTNQGITLVDTPGADSIHARHTDVSFNYIKNADAIIYVTYYNHAFAKADKDFIRQLGRVKEAFELDKMFFIVNAADLATNDAELKMVIEHVKEELLNLGVRFPNIYPVSSKQSLQNKINHERLNKYMQTFEKAFNEFIQFDLTKIVVKTALWNIERSKQLLDQYIEKVSMDTEMKEQAVIQLQNIEHDLLKIVQDERTDFYQTQIQERIKRQLHYVGERFSIRFHDLFRETFNPTTIKSGQRQELEKCLHQLIVNARFELLQEMRAVSLRIEAIVRTLTDDLSNDFNKQLQTIDEQFLLRVFEPLAIESPTFTEAFQTIDKRSFSRALRLFKSTRAFFEQRESERMKEAIYEILAPNVEQYINEQQQVMSDFYENVWNQNVASFKKYCEREINNYTNQQQMMLEQPIDIDTLHTKANKLIAITEHI